MSDFKKHPSKLKHSRHGGEVSIHIFSSLHLSSLPAMKSARQAAIGYDRWLLLKHKGQESQVA